jgi:predicted lipoprotein
MSNIEFIRLDGQAVRVTSLRRDEQTGSIELVIVVRGSTAAMQLRDLKQRPSILIEIPDEEPRPYKVSGIDWRGVGHGEQTMNRFRLTFRPVEAVAEVSAAENDEPAERETQLDRIERKLDEILRKLNG